MLTHSDGMDPGPDFLAPTSTVQHVLESVDLLTNMVDAYPDVGSTNPGCVTDGRS